MTNFVYMLAVYCVGVCGTFLVSVILITDTTVWFRRSRISLPLRLRLYDSFVVPVLIYNMGTWGLTKAELERLDAYHRRHLRQIIGIHWPHRISNTALYRRCRCRPISENVKSARWRLFGHVLRMPLDAPAQQAIDFYFADTGVATFRGRPTIV